MLYGKVCTILIVLCYRVTTIYPVQDQTALQDRRVMSLIQYAKKVEKSMFEVARSRVSLCVCVCVCVCYIALQYVAQW